MYLDLKIFKLFILQKYSIKNKARMIRIDRRKLENMKIFEILVYTDNIKCLRIIILKHLTIFFRF